MESGLIRRNTTGSWNTASGLEALYFNTTGSSNTANGYRALLSNTTGSYNTFIGYQAQANADNYTNSTALGANAIITASNQVVLGDLNVTQVASYGTWTALSDARHKKDIEDLPLGLEFIDSIKTHQYRLKEGGGDLRFGVVAQELEQALPESLRILVNTENGLALLNRENNDERTYHVGYGELTAPMIKAIQELHAQNKELQARNSELEAELSSLKARMDAFERTR